MAYTIIQSFSELKSNLNITSLQGEKVSTRQKNVRAVIEEEMDVEDSFLTGSYSRNTMIAPLHDADVDICIILDEKYFHHYNEQNGGQGGLLDLVKRTLVKEYPNTPHVSRNGQAVTIQFTDFAVDVVPAFYREGGGYLIPNSISQSWISTDPKKHVSIVSTANVEHEGDFVPLVKMIKGWNRSNSSYFNSFHLEVLALAILDSVTIGNFPSAIRYFFDKSKNIINQKNLDPAGYGGDVGSYLNTQDKIDNAVSRFQTAYNRAVKAEEYAIDEKTELAAEEWRKIFGNYFPIYG